MMRTILAMDAVFTTVKQSMAEVAKDRMTKDSEVAWKAILSGRRGNKTIIQTKKGGCYGNRNWRCNRLHFGGVLLRSNPADMSEVRQVGTKITGRVKYPCRKQEKKDERNEH